MLILRGAPALSTFRREKLLTRLQQSVSGLTALSAHYVHFVQLREPLNAEEQTVLEALLTYGPRTQEASVVSGQEFVVVPRPGTISPWSSKATDIAHNTGLDKVQRIERGICYAIEGVIDAAAHPFI